MSNVITCARGWLGVPYQHQGRSRLGVDCAGLVICVLRDLGIVPPEFDVNGYGNQPDGTLLSVVRQHLAEGPAEPGAIAALRFGLGPQHLAVLADYPGGHLSMVHALERNGCVVEHRLDDEWRGRIVATFKAQVH